MTQRQKVYRVYQPPKQSPWLRLGMGVDMFQGAQHVPEDLNLANVRTVPAICPPDAWHTVREHRPQDRPVPQQKLPRGNIARCSIHPNYGISRPPFSKHPLCTCKDIWEAKQREIADITVKCSCVLAVNARRSTGLESIELADPECSACGGWGWHQ